MRSNGSIIGPKRTVSVSSAPGIWSIRDAQRERGGVNWPTVFNEANWVTASGQLGGTFHTLKAVSTSVSATGATSYAVQSGSLPTGVSLNTSTGAITGTPSGIADYNSGTTFNFTIRATSGGDTIDRAFFMIVRSYYYGYTCGTASEGGTASITAPAGYTFTRRDFGSYGTPGGSCGAFTVGGCQANATFSVNTTSISVPMNNATWGDPCSGTPKYGYIQASYTLTTVYNS